MVNRILRNIEGKQYKIVFLDPAYKCLGDRVENDAGDITDFQNHVERIATEAGCAIVITGHAPKGNLVGRSANDMQSGSGVWARDPDVVASFLDITDNDSIIIPKSAKELAEGEAMAARISKAHDDLDGFEDHIAAANSAVTSVKVSDIYGSECIKIQFSGMREDKTPEPFYARWEYPIFRKIEGNFTKEKPEGKAGRPPKSDKSWELCTYFRRNENERLTYSQLFARAAQSGMKEGTFKNRLRDAKAAGAIEQDYSDEVYFVKWDKFDELRNGATATIKHIGQSIRLKTPAEQPVQSEIRF